MIHLVHDLVSAVSTIGGSGAPCVGIVNYPPSERGRPDPAGTGLLLDDTNFYPDD